MNQSTATMGQDSSHINHTDARAATQPVQNSEQVSRISATSHQLQTSKAEKSSSHPSTTPSSTNDSAQITREDSKSSSSKARNASVNKDNRKSKVPTARLRNTSDNSTAVSSKLHFDSSSYISTPSFSAPAPLQNQQPIYDGSNPRQLTYTDYGWSPDDSLPPASASNPRSQNASSLAATNLTSARHLTRNTATDAVAATPKHHPEPEKGRDAHESEAEDDRLFVSEDDDQASHRDVASAPPSQPPAPKRSIAVIDEDTLTASQPRAKRTKRSKRPREVPRAGHRSPEDIGASGGTFTTEELEDFKAWKVKFCEENGFTKEQLLAMFHEKAHKSNEKLSEMYKELYDLFPVRDQHAVRKFARRNAGWARRGGAWTKEEDDLVRRMAAPPRTKTWQEIGDLIDRFGEDVRNRWRDKLRPGNENASAGHWSDTEVAELYRAYSVCSHRAEGAKPAWPAVCEEMMGNSRSRVQCTQKWTALQKRADHAEKLAAAMRRAAE